MKNSINTLAMWLIIGVIFIVVLSAIVENSDSKLKYSELITNINSGNVESIEIESDGKLATVTLKDDRVKKEVNIPDMGSFMTYTEDFLKDGAFSLEEESQSIFITCSLKKTHSRRHRKPRHTLRSEAGIYKKHSTEKHENQTFEYTATCEPLLGQLPKFRRTDPYLIGILPDNAESRYRQGEWRQEGIPFIPAHAGRPSS